LSQGSIFIRTTNADFLRGSRNFWTKVADSVDLPRLANGDAHVFIRENPCWYAQGRQPGNQIVRVQVSCDEWQTPATREESTRGYQIGKGIL
jgi:hypothetical protein